MGVDFFDSTDITGKALTNLFDNGRMYAMCPYDYSLCNIFNVKTIKGLKDCFDERLKEQLLDSSITFKTSKVEGKRHPLMVKNIYSSFDLKNTRVTPLESQRNTLVRIKRFKIKEKDLIGKKVLDIGSNIGATLLHLEKYKPSFMKGLEYDADKVALSNKLAKYNGIQNIVFEEYDIENPPENKQEEEYEVVFCLAVIEHLKQKEKLYKLLGDVCSEKLYFEGNGNSDINVLEAGLKNAGFKSVTYLGFSNDEKKNTNNNNRPLFIALK